MSIFKPNISKSPNVKREEKSILFLENIFVESRVKTHLSKNDKTANIDGYLELLDEEMRFIGKMAVQVKTVPKKYQGKNKSPCPTSLFGFAESTAEDVFIIAVDHSRKIALWKHISRSLIQDNADKGKQKSIIVSFERSEELFDNNLEDTISRLMHIVRTDVKLFDSIPQLLTENEDLRQKLVSFQNSAFSINTAEVSNVQLFVDSLNKLLDNEFSYIKRLFYPQMWKRGVAIFEYIDSELSYALYSIKYGENSLLFKELPIDEMKNFRDFSSRNCIENAIKMHPVRLSVELIKLDVDRFLKNQRVLPLQYEFVNEYIIDFVDENWRSLKIDKGLLSDLKSFLGFMIQNYPRIDTGTSYHVGNKHIPIHLLYRCLNFMVDNGYYEVSNLYPERSHIHKTGMVCDSYSPENAYLKAKYIFETIPRLYNNFILNHFPLLITELDLFYNADLVLIDIKYTGNGGELFDEEHSICMYYFRCKVKIPSRRDFIFSFNSDAEIYKENNIDGDEDFFNMRLIKHNGISYEAFRRDGVNMHTSIWGRNNLLNTLYEFLEKKFNDYFKDILK